jgi:hypothetical protein
MSEKVAGIVIAKLAKQQYNEVWISDHVDLLKGRDIKNQ